MEDLLVNQKLIQDSMKQLLTNFKKDGAGRKTTAHIKKCLSTLDSYWQQYQSNNIKLCEFEDKSDEYFVSDYKQTSEFYIETRAYIMNQLSAEEKGHSHQQDTASTSYQSSSSFQKNPTPREWGTSSKLEEMLRKQKSNFKAFERTISIINLDAVSEKWEFEDILKSIQVRWSVIDSLHWEIDSELLAEDSEYEGIFFKHEQKYHEVKKAINSKMWSQTHREKATPQMDIPTFGGNYHQWVSFKDLFVESIHNNRSLSNGQKMQFLKSKLKGEAEKLIQHLHISSDNYEISWDILNHRYNNNKLIFNSHLSILMNLPTLQYQSAAAIKKMHDVTNECLNAIKALGVEISSWDPVLVYIISNKLDADTHNDYIESLKNPRDLPSLQELLEFLESKFTSLESSKRKPDPAKTYHNQETSSSNARKSHYYKSFTSNQNYSANKSCSFKQVHSSVQTCPVCNKNHGIFHCDTFLELQPNMKLTTITKLSLCKNCLYDHHGKECRSFKKCRLCKEDHNTLLHEAFGKITKNMPPGNDASKQPTLHKNNVLQEETGEVLLATTLVHVQAADGSYHKLRALIDQGSQTSIISENAAQQLGLQRKRCKGVIFGVGAKESNCKGVMSINISSIYNDYSLNTDVFIMKQLINNLPNKSFAKPSWPFIAHIQLADPEFYVSRQVDLLLGADIYSTVILSGIIKENDCLPIAQQTRFGWILSGNANGAKSYHCNVIMINEQDFQRFWAIEDITESNDISAEDQHCLQFYKSTTKRQADGKYVVRLPLHPDINEKLGQSKHKAIAQFYQLERKFQTQKNVAEGYISFINEYIALGHMHPADSHNTLGYYLPHHCVQRAESTTTSLRVVFNASGSSSSGNSLNDLMYKGPNLQQDLLSLILNWRQYQYAFTADIEKMFRQILVHEDDQIYQKIIWRISADQQLQDYQLATVTYGTKAAPFLAMMTLRQLAEDESETFPEASKVLKNQFYMDDLLSGSHTIESAKQLQADLIELLRSGGFNLRKWTSNEPALLESIKNNSESQANFDFRHQESTKALGLTWIAKDDTFTFQCKMSEDPLSKPTKRHLLADISKIYDPLGWLAPLTIRLKLLFQNVWSIDLKWDDEVSDVIKHDWKNLSADMANINKIKISRWVQSGEKECMELHGYSDASMKAYSCVIYARITNKNKSSITLLAAKTKVVPISKSGTEVSLPRLELCGAHLLSKLMIKVKQSLQNHDIEVHGWSDSKAVLSWIQGEPTRWKPFVANRVRKITETMPSKCWHYVPSKENPADCASRGLTVNQLQQHSLWWNGPPSLSSFNQDKEEKSVFTTDLESKKIKQSNISQMQNTNDCIIQQLIDKHSSFTRVYRVLAWIQRAVSRNRNTSSFLTADELRAAKLKIIKHIQKQEYSEEISDLLQEGKVKSKSKILKLNPYLDKDGLLRVLGRLRNASISEDMKYPLIIPNRGHLTDLIIDHAHKRTFHGTAGTTLSHIRNQYWIVGGNRAVKNKISKCVLCKRHNPNKHQQLMGDLPASRTNPSRPFYHSGVDYTGFVDVKSSKGRGIKSTKGYVAVFVCMVTKAVHFELVSDLTSSAFLAALRRLAARRGTPGHIYSDCGTNFVGANKILQREYLDLKSICTEEFLTEISEMQIKWHFNAPAWPSAGGLWESNVKQLKHHLRRVVGEQKLTYEEYATLLAQLEACLNARPLCAITEDPNDIDYLTPSHFLASGPALTIIETERDERTRWRLTQKIFQDLWKRWQSEYLTQLSIRSKWQRTHPNIKLDDIVIIHDANLPAGKWALARVIELHPGKDGLVRVVSLKTKNGIIKRPIVKISILPTSNEQQVSQSDQANNSKQRQNTEVSTNQNTKQRKVKAFKTSCINFMTTIFLLFMLVATSAVHGAYNITTLKSNNSIYFDKLSNMRLIQDKWKLVVYYDMEPYWYGNRLLGDYCQHLDRLCTSLAGKSRCEIILLQLRHGLEEMKHYDRMLQSQAFDKPLRVRRGLIDGVGYIANSLFGVLDERFAEQYQRDITMIRKNQKQLAQYWKNQTSIIEAEHNLLKRIKDNIEQQHKVFNQHLNSLGQAINIIGNEVVSMEIMEEFTVSSIIANNVLSNLKAIQDNLIDTITNVRHFNFHLLTPAQLQEELSIVSGQLTKDLSLPVDNIQTDLAKIYKILKVRARMTSQYFIFEVQIPLINRDNYDIYKLLPVPRPEAGEMVSITPISNYMAIDIKKDTYITIALNDLQNCIKLEPDTNLCEFQKPVYQRQSDHNLCIKDQYQNKCKTISSTCQDVWNELSKQNTFMLTCCGQCTLRIICENQVATEQLHGVSLIALGNDCVIKGESFTITSHKQHSNDIYIKPEIVTVKIAPVNYLINLSLPINQMKETTSNFTEPFANIQKQITQMKTASEPTDDDNSEISFHDVHHYVAIYVVAAAGLAYAVYAYVRARRTAARSQEAPAPRAAPAVSEAEDSDQCFSAKAEHSEVQCSCGLKHNVKSDSVFSVNTASSPIFTRCSFKKTNRE